MTLVAGLPLLIALSAAAGASGAPASSSVEVVFEKGLVSANVKAVPFDRVMDELARRTGMRVTYDGERPTSLVTAHIANVPPGRAMEQLVEGLALNYIMTFDPTNTQVTSVVFISGIRGTSSGASRAEVSRAPFGSVVNPMPEPDEPSESSPADDATLEMPTVPVLPPVPVNATAPANATRDASAAGRPAFGGPNGRAAAGPMPVGGGAPGSVTGAVSSAADPGDGGAAPNINASGDDWVQRNGTFPGSVARPPTKPDHPQD